MPLRSVEAATRDDAIAAAREQFGASARVVGVRRVRSGGVLGFFATERYVAEVDPDPAARPAVPVPAPSRSAAERRPARDDVRPVREEVPSRTAVPARNAAAAWAAEVRSTPSPAPARTPRRDDDARVDELAGLLGQSSAAPSPVPLPRASAGTSFVRPTREPEPEAPVRPAVVRPAAVRPAWSELLGGTAAAEPAPAARVTPAAAPPVDEPQPVGSAATPSPFTAALARMVAGDRDVQQAVEDALAAPSGEPAPQNSDPWPTWSGSLPAAQTTASPSPAAREEEPVELQDWTPSSPSLADAPVADWGVAKPAAPPVVSREEAIAEVLRAALDEGRSGETLTGILRKVMDGASPAAALAETPFEAPAPAAEPVAVMEPVVVEPVVVEPVVVEPVIEPVAAASVAEPVVEPVPAAVEVERVVEFVPAQPVAEPVAEAAIVAEPDVAGPDAAGPDVAEAPVAVEWSAPTPVSGSELGWDDPVSSSLWADVTPVAARTDQPVDAPAQAAEAPVEAAEETVVAVEASTVEAVEQAVAEEAPVQEEVAPTTVIEENVVMEAADAPMLARTASDPAPLSLDATTVMPPLSLLPPLPSRRGGRPPVPPSVHRGSSARPAARPTAPAEDREAPTDVDRSESLATVTRLPLVPADETPAPAAQEAERVEVAAAEPTPAVAAPVEETAEDTIPEVPALEQTAVLPTVAAEPEGRRPEPVVERPRAAAPVRRPAVVVPAPAPRVERTRPVAASRPAPAAAGDLVSGLRALGLPEELLGAGFAADAEAHGTYAALTRALAARLPETPELPSGAGEVLVVVGPGVETLRAARALAATLRLDTDRVQWATRGDLAGLVPASSRMATVEAAIERRQEAIGSGTLTIVAVDAPLRTDAYWTAQMLAIWAPVAVWAVVEATRKPEDLGPWIEGLPHVDALMVQDTDLSADPAAVLHRVAMPLDLPVAVVDGMRATPHRWASLLCERLETPQG